MSSVPQTRWMAGLGARFATEMVRHEEVFFAKSGIWCKIIIIIILPSAWYLVAANVGPHGDVAVVPVRTAAPDQLQSSLSSRLLPRSRATLRFSYILQGLVFRRVAIDPKVWIDYTPYL
jgi:hypothetical protein